MQRDVDRLLIRGGDFSIVWLLGVGSIYSIDCAAKARRLIVASAGELRGMGRVWWCFLVGGYGVAILLMLSAAMVWNARGP